MKIYTRTGDSGETALYGGGRVFKDALRVESYGEVDNANAAIGLARSLLAREFQELDAELHDVQQNLFDIGAELATPVEAREAALARLPRVRKDDADALERSIDRAEEELPKLKTFILPGGHSAAAALHLARTTVRQAERRIVALHRQEPIRPELLVYVNRLSDYLFVMARLVNHRSGSAEHTWESTRRVAR